MLRFSLPTITALASLSLSACKFNGPAFDDPASCTEQKSEITYTYDAAGRRIAERTTQGDAWTLVERRFDEAGRLIERRRSRPGRTQFSEDRAYDPGGHVTQVTVLEDGDEWRLDAEYDDAGQLSAVTYSAPISLAWSGMSLGALSRSMLFDAGPTLPEGLDLPTDWALFDERSRQGTRVELTRDEQGRVIGEVWDHGLDGLIDVRRETTYTDEGQLTRTDEGDDGTVEREDLRVFDADGQLVEHIVRSSTGATERAMRIEANASETMVRFDLDGDGTFEAWRREQFDASGNRVLKEEDLDGDGLIEYRKASEYDADGRRLHDARDEGANGVDQLVDYEYDAQDRVARELITEASGAAFCDASN